MMSTTLSTTRPATVQQPQQEMKALSWAERLRIPSKMRTVVVSPKIIMECSMKSVEPVALPPPQKGLAISGRKNAAAAPPAGAVLVDKKQELHPVSNNIKSEVVAAAVVRERTERNSTTTPERTTASPASYVEEEQATITEADHTDSTNQHAEVDEHLQKLIVKPSPAGDHGPRGCTSSSSSCVDSSYNPDSDTSPAFSTTTASSFSPSTSSSSFSPLSSCGTSKAGSFSQAESHEAEEDEEQNENHVGSFLDLRSIVLSKFAHRHAAMANSITKSQSTTTCSREEKMDTPCSVIPVDGVELEILLTIHTAMEAVVRKEHNYRKMNYSKLDGSNTQTATQIQHGMQLFGSSVNGFRSKNSDLDLSWDLPDSVVREEALARLHDELEVMLTMTTTLTEHEEDNHVEPQQIQLLSHEDHDHKKMNLNSKPVISHLHRLELIPSRKTPILRCHFRKNGGTTADQATVVEISVRNEAGIANSVLLKNLGESLHQDASLLGILVKQWAKRRQIPSASAGGLSSYCLILMVLYFLGSRSSTSSCSQDEAPGRSCYFRNDPAGRFESDKTNGGEHDEHQVPASGPGSSSSARPTRRTPTTTLEQLFLEFCEFYTAPPTRAVNTRSSGTIATAPKRPSDTHQDDERHVVSSDQVALFPFHFDKNTDCVCVRGMFKDISARVAQAQQELPVSKIMSTTSCTQGPGAATSASRTPSRRSCTTPLNFSSPSAHNSAGVSSSSRVETSTVTTSKIPKPNPTDAELKQTWSRFGRKPEQLYVRDPLIDRNVAETCSAKNEDLFFQELKFAKERMREFFHQEELNYAAEETTHDTSAVIKGAAATAQSRHHDQMTSNKGMLLNQKSDTRSGRTSAARNTSSTELHPGDGGSRLNRLQSRTKILEELFLEQPGVEFSHQHQDQNEDKIVSDVEQAPDHDFNFYYPIYPPPPPATDLRGLTKTKTWPGGQNAEVRQDEEPEPAGGPPEMITTTRPRMDIESDLEHYTPAGVLALRAITLHEGSFAIEDTPETSCCCTSKNPSSWEQYCYRVLFQRQLVRPLQVVDDNFDQVQLQPATAVEEVQLEGHQRQQHDCRKEELLDYCLKEVDKMRSMAVVLSTTSQQKVLASTAATTSSTPTGANMIMGCNRSTATSSRSSTSSMSTSMSTENERRDDPSSPTSGFTTPWYWQDPQMICTNYNPWLLPAYSSYNKREQQAGGPRRMQEPSIIKPTHRIDFQDGWNEENFVQYRGRFSHWRCRVDFVVRRPEFDVQATCGTTTSMCSASHGVVDEKISSTRVFYPKPELLRIRKKFGNRMDLEAEDWYEKNAHVHVDQNCARMKSNHNSIHTSNAVGQRGANVFNSKITQRNRTASCALDHVVHQLQEDEGAIFNQEGPQRTASKSTGVLGQQQENVNGWQLHDNGKNTSSWSSTYFHMFSPMKIFRQFDPVSLEYCFTIKAKAKRRRERPFASTAVSKCGEDDSLDLPPLCDSYVEVGLIASSPSSAGRSCTTVNCAKIITLAQHNREQEQLHADTTRRTSWQERQRCSSNSLSFYTGSSSSPCAAATLFGGAASGGTTFCDTWQRSTTVELFSTSPVEVDESARLCEVELQGREQDKVVVPLLETRTITIRVDVKQGIVFAEDEQKNAAGSPAAPATLPAKNVLTAHRRTSSSSPGGIKGNKTRELFRFPPNAAHVPFVKLVTCGPAGAIKADDQMEMLEFECVENSCK
ncbi:unnamed protein product [Amoebophrya sp. A120]|nr:unnamed protein product [Amoebophrya sp. A120]|eukprot:GSA120T00013518001.1